MALLYDYCACCGRRIEISYGEVVFETYKDGEPLTFCRGCIKMVNVDMATGIETWEGEKP